jgi:hypothetical protein
LANHGPHQPLADPLHWGDKCRFNSEGSAGAAYRSRLQPTAPRRHCALASGARTHSRLPVGVWSGPGYAHAIHRLLGRARSLLVGAAVLGIGYPPVRVWANSYMISILITMRKNG